MKATRVLRNQGGGQGYLTSTLLGNKGQWFSFWHGDIDITKSKCSPYPHTLLCAFQESSPLNFRQSHNIVAQPGRWQAVAEPGWGRQYKPVPMSLSRSSWEALLKVLINHRTPTHSLFHLVSIKDRETDTKSKSNKSRNKQVGLHKIKKFLLSKGNHQQNENGTYWIGENICKLFIWKGAST